MEISQSYPLSFTKGAMTVSSVLVHHSLMTGPGGVLAIWSTLNRTNLLCGSPRTKQESLGISLKMTTTENLGIGMLAYTSVTCLASFFLSSAVNAPTG